MHKITTQEASIDISIEPHRLSGIYYIPDKAKALVVLSHGAGAGMTHHFMEGLATELGSVGIATLRFNLPYMEKGKKMPGSPKQAMEGIQEAAQQAHKDFPDLSIYLAGKSYGGRMSSELMASYPINFVRGLIFYGFPLHAPGKPSDKRAGHLQQVQCPMLFLQGSNDKLAQLELLQPVVRHHHLASIEVFEHADHSYKRPKKVSEESLIPTLANATSNWMNSL